jgi:hypothetical protein
LCSSSPPELGTPVPLGPAWCSRSPPLRTRCGPGARAQRSRGGLGRAPRGGRQRGRSRSLPRFRTLPPRDPRDGPGARVASLGNELEAVELQSRSSIRSASARRRWAMSSSNSHQVGERAAIASWECRPRRRETSSRATNSSSSITKLANARQRGRLGHVVSHHHARVGKHFVKQRREQLR